MNKNEKTCDLCGLAVEINDFKLRTRDGVKIFCCEGCKGIYQLLHEDAVNDTSDGKQKTD